MLNEEWVLVTEEEEREEKEEQRRIRLLRDLLEEMGQTNDDRLTNDYETLQRRLRLLSYGCYSKNDLKKMLGVGGSSVSHYDIFLKNILPEDMVMEAGRGKKKRVQIKGDRYYVRDNYLAEMYFIENLQGYDLLYYIAVLRILAACEPGEGCNANEIARIISGENVLYERTCKGKKITDDNHLDTRAAYYLPAKLHLEAELMPEDESVEKRSLIDSHNVSKRLKEMARMGLVEPVKNKKNSYQLAVDVLKGLSEAELHELEFAVDFFKNIAPLEVPGFYLAALIAVRLGTEDKGELPFQYANMDLRRILDDESAYRLYKAYKEGGLDVSFFYRDPSAKDKSYAEEQEKVAAAEREQNNRITQLKREKKELQEADREVPASLLEEISSVQEAVSQERQMEKCPWEAPDHIVTEHFSGRQHFISSTGHSYRLDGMSYIRKSPQEPGKKNDRQREKNRWQIRLRVHYGDKTKAEALQRSLSTHLPGAGVRPEGDGTFICTIEGTGDSGLYRPILRQYLPKAEVLADGTTPMRQWIAADIEEMLRSYGKE